MSAIQWNMRPRLSREDHDKNRWVVHANLLVDGPGTATNFAVPLELPAGMAPNHDVILAAILSLTDLVPAAVREEFETTCREELLTEAPA